MGFEPLEDTLPSSKSSTMKHYTYKVTFPGMPWYYWGVHTENGKPYYGSPVTNRWVWDFYECEVQVLERFEARKEAEEVETRLIKFTISDPNCLNEHYGGHFSEGARLRGMQTQRERGIGLFDPLKRRRGPHTKETIQKMREAKIGKPRDEATRLKISKGHLGKKFSIETRKKLSESKAGENNPNFGKKGEETSTFGTKWWINVAGETRRQAESPGPEWQQGRKWRG